VVEVPDDADRLTEAQQKAHAYARGQGFSRTLYALVRVLATAVLRTWFRLRVSGSTQIPSEGGVIVAPNHKNFLDPFFIGIATRRPVRFMAKTELFTGPMGWLFLRLGAFPIRRGESDTEALETAAAILGAGGLVVVFPEGTRVEQPDALGAPRRGAGRLAIETEAPIIPAAITGTSHLWRGALPKLRRIQIAFLPPVEPPATAGRDPASALIDDRVWPAVQEEYGRLAARPGLIAAALTAAGVGGGLLARRRLQASRKPRLLGKIEPRRLRPRKARRGRAGRFPLSVGRPLQRPPERWWRRN
jgi:1-acyl-sn-glycerol-3-phosphate acyltransferase